MQAANYMQKSRLKINKIDYYAFKDSDLKENLAAKASKLDEFQNANFDKLYSQVHRKRLSDLKADRFFRRKLQMQIID